MTAISKISINTAIRSGPHFGLAEVEKGMTERAVKMMNITGADNRLEINNQLIFDATDAKPAESRGLSKTSIISDWASANNPAGTKKRSPQMIKNQLRGEAVLVSVNILTIKTAMITIPTMTPR